MSIIEFFKQKSPQQRFLFILGLFMLVFYLGLGIILIFFKEVINLGIPDAARIAMGVLVMVYAGIRFGRLLNKKDDEV